MSIALVTTTIHVPYILEAYAEDAKNYGFDDLKMIVVGDLKTPPETKDFCLNLQNKFGLDCIYLDVESQKEFTRNFPQLDTLIPFNCIQRRNIGLLFAYIEGSDIIVTIDDDNFISQENYFAAHQIVGRSLTAPVFNSSTGWLNVCDFLEDTLSRKFYPRGHPLAQRQGSEQVSQQHMQVKVVANAGFWLGDPDIDAITRLAIPIDVVSYKFKQTFCLAHETYAPINSQNTSIRRDALPAYFLAPYVGRFDDIWAGYFLKRIADHLGDFFAFGPPLVKQIRNPHNLWNDLENERLGLELSDLFCKTLRSIKLDGTGYHTCAKQLLEGLKSALSHEFFGLKDDRLFFIWRFVKGYEGWLEVFEKAALFCSS